MLSDVCLQAAAFFNERYDDGDETYLKEPNRIVECKVAPKINSYLRNGGKIPEGIVYYESDDYCYGSLADCLEFLEKLGFFDDPVEVVIDKMCSIVDWHLAPLDVMRLDCWEHNRGTFAYTRSAEIMKLTGVSPKVVNDVYIWIPRRFACTPEQALKIYQARDLVEDAEMPELAMAILRCDPIHNNDDYDLSVYEDVLENERHKRIYDVALNCYNNDWGNMK